MLNITDGWTEYRWSQEPACNGRVISCSYVLTCELQWERVQKLVFLSSVSDVGVSCHAAAAAAAVAADDDDSGGGGAADEDAWRRSTERLRRLTSWRCIIIINYVSTSRCQRAAAAAYTSACQWYRHAVLDQLIGLLRWRPQHQTHSSNSHGCWLACTDYSEQTQLSLRNRATHCTIRSGVADP